MKRNFVEPEFTITTWENLKPYFDNLLARNLNAVNDLKQLLLDASELGAVISENMAWRYINMTCDTTDTKLRDHFNDFVQNIEPHMAPITNQLNLKINNCSFKNQFVESGYPIYFRGIKNSIDLFREENIPLNTKLQELEQKFGEISGAQSIEHDGKTITMQQAGVYLKNLDRSIREQVYTKLQTRRAQDEEALNSLYTELISLRHQVALNAGFSNFRDFKHQSLGRFDYSVQDCLTFHQSVKDHAVELLNNLHQQRKQKLNLSTYKPWDTSVDEEALPPLQPFKNGAE